MSEIPVREAAILIIEDDDVARTSFQKMLTGAGYMVRRASSAAVALAMLKSAPADLILMSLLLPDADGFALCSTLRTQSDAPIIIVLDKRSGEVDRVLALACGAVDWLTKPMDTDELLGRVEAVLEARASQRHSGRE
jgi:DNA-binding response OmpR family regulator